MHIYLSTYIGMCFNGCSSADCSDKKKHAIVKSPPPGTFVPPNQCKLYAVSMNTISSTKYNLKKNSMKKKKRIANYQTKNDLWKS